MTERPLTAYLVRHARSLGNSTGRVQGWLDLPLDALGRRQAERLADRFRGWRFDALYSSPLARAADTARAIAAVTGTDIHFDARLREYNMGAFTGMTAEEIQAFLSGAGLSPRAEYEWVAPGGESAQETYDRTRVFAWDMVRRHPGQTIMVVSHAGALGAMISAMLGLPPARRHPFGFGNTSVAKVIHDPHGRWRLRSLNDLCHLDEGEQ